MAKGIEKDALAMQGKAASDSGSAFGAANPVLTRMATDPMGYTQQQKSDMLTAGGQSIGGSTAGVVGQGNLTAARTNNIGGQSMALDAAARAGDQQSSVNALGVLNQDAELKQKQQQFGLQGLQGEYSDANRTGIDALGQATNAGNATNAAWQGPMNAALGAAGTAAGAYMGKKP